MVLLVAVGFVVGGPAGAGLLALAGAVMLLGRFWWQADVVRQAVWRVAEPAGWLKRREAHEDRTTRRQARTMGGMVWLAAAAMVALGAGAGWVLAGAIALMVALDASLDFCALCFAFGQLDRAGRLPSVFAHDAAQPCAGDR